MVTCVMIISFAYKMNVGKITQFFNVSVNELKYTRYGKKAQTC